MAGESRKNPAREVVARGPHGTVEFGIRSNGSMEAKEFLESPECKRTKPALLALFQALVHRGPDDDEISPIPLRKTSIREFKKSNVRIFCFKHNSAWVLTNGFLKKSNQTPKKHIERAEDIMREDLARFGDNRSSGR